MVLAIKIEPPPLKLLADGTIRVGDTRVTLDMVIHAYLSGSTAEEIAEDSDTLDLGDVHTVLGYYLRHKDEVDQYLVERQRYADEVRALIEARQGSQEGLHEKLLARRANKEC